MTAREGSKAASAEQRSALPSPSINAGQRTSEDGGVGHNVDDAVDAIDAEPDKDDGREGHANGAGAESLTEEEDDEDGDGNGDNRVSY